MADSDNPLPIQPDDNPWLTTPTDAAGRPVITVTPRNAQNNLTDPTIGVDYGNYTDPLIDDVKEAAAKIFGLNGQDRYQLWPERLVRSALSAPHDALSGQIQPGSEEEISRAMDMASLAGVGPIGASPGEATLGSGMTRMAAKDLPKFELPSKGTDIIGRDIPDWRGANVYHFTDEDAANSIADEGYKSGSGYYGDMVSFSTDPTYAKQFGNVATQAKISNDAKILNLNDPSDWSTYQQITKNVDGSKIAQAIKKSSYDGVYDAGAGDLFIANPKVAQFQKSISLLSDTSKPGMAIQANAPVFYSAVENAVKNAKLDNAPVSQWLGYLKNQPGVKQEELDWTLGDLPTDQKMSKTDMQNYVDANKVQLQEVNKGGLENNTDDIDSRIREISNWPADPTKAKNPSDQSELDDLNSEWERLQTVPTKFSQYQLPGGSNYKEMLMQLPVKTSPKAQQAFDLTQRMQNGDFNSLDDTDRRDLFAQRDQLLKDARTEEGASPYQSSHWDEPNVLAHVRMNDRNVDGLKTLNLEEIQSDWHQQGRQQGYQLTPQQKTNFDAIDQKIVNSGDEDIMGDPDIKSAIGKAVDKKILTPEEGRTYLQNYRGADAQNPVPNAPFKQTWPDLALKRMIRYASDNGYDALSWTPGEAQAARYDLSKQVNNIEWNKKISGNNNKIEIDTKDGGNIALEYDNSGKITKNEFEENNRYDQYIGKHLSDVVGKEIAQKMLEKKSGSLSGLDLKVGGEGMKAFYDKMLVDKANAIAKKYGGKVEDRNLESLNKNYRVGPKNPNGSYDVRFTDKMGSERFNATYPTKEEAQARVNELNAQKGDAIHFLRLPQSLKDTAQQKGFPLFSGGFMLNPVQQNPFSNDSVNVDGKQIPINNKQDVMWGAGASNNSDIVNIDKRIPRYDDKLKLPNGQPADLYKYLAIHETAEKPVMERLIAEGKTKEQAYLLAHTQVATPAEKAAVEADGLNWNEYEKVIDGYLKQTEHEKPDNAPSDLYTKPYNHNQLRKMKFKPINYNPFTDS